MTNYRSCFIIATTECEAKSTTPSARQEVAEKLTEIVWHACADSEKRLRIMDRSMIEAWGVDKRRLPRLVISLFAFIGIILASGLMFSAPSYAATPPDSCFGFAPSGNLIHNYYDNEGNNPSNPACPRDVDIPYSIGGVAVLSIVSGFSGKHLTSVTIPNSVNYIGYGVFANNDLTSVTIPNSVNNIGGSAFANNDLTSVTIPDNGMYLSDSLFDNNQLTSVTVPGSVQLGNRVFSNNKLTSVTISEGVESIGQWAFADNNLTSVTIPSSVTTIEYGAFQRNSLTSVTISEGVESISVNAFDSNNLTSVTIPRSVTSILPAAFTYNQTAYPSAEFRAMIESSDTATKQTARDAINFVALSIEGGGNPNNLKDDVFPGYGGHLINPARLVVNYLSSDSGTIAPAFTTVGQRADGTPITSYLVKDAGTYPNPVDDSSPTPAEQAAIDAYWAQYYRVGQSVSLTLPDVAGYVTPTPAQRTFNLGAANTTENITYLASAEGAGDSQSPATPVAGDSLAETGVNAAAMIASALAMLTVGIAVLAQSRISRRLHTRHIGKASIGRL